MSVLCVGGAGYLGQRVVHYLAQVGYPITVYDSLLYQQAYLDERATFHRGDITEYLHIPRMLPGVDCVVWLAAIVGDAACAADPAWARAVNVTSLLNFLKKYEGPMVWPSSCSVYGAADGVSNEESPLNPLSLYAEMKVEVEQALSSRPNTYVLRLATLHGVSERMRFDLMVNTMTRSAVESGVVNVFGGNQYRPLTHVDDVASLILRLVGGGYTPGTYNVVTENLTALEVAHRVEDGTGAKIEVAKTTVEDKRDYRVDASRARAELGYSPLYTVQDSIGHIKRLLESGRLRDTSEPQYINEKCQGRNSWKNRPS